MDNKEIIIIFTLSRVYNTKVSGTEKNTTALVNNAVL